MAKMARFTFEVRTQFSEPEQAAIDDALESDERWKVNPVDFSWLDFALVIDDPDDVALKLHPRWVGAKEPRADFAIFSRLASGKETAGAFWCRVKFEKDWKAVFLVF